MTARVLASAANELYVALYNLGWPAARVYGLEWAERIHRERPDLCGRVAAWWPDATTLVGHGAELLVMAALGGYMADTDPARLFAALPGLPGLAPGRPRPDRPFARYPDLAELVSPRIKALTAPNVMAEYVALLREVWACVVEPEWHARGLPTIQAEALEFRQRLDRGEAVKALIPAQHLVHLDWCAPVLAHYVERDRVVVLPSYLAQGFHAFDIGEFYYVGYGLRTAGLGRARAERAARVALRMKAFSDPTRLSILAYLSHVPVSVSDLAAILGVAQPTVSEHLRLLRDAGLVTAEREGNKVYYRTDRAAVKELLGLAASLTTP